MAASSSGKNIVGRLPATAAAGRLLEGRLCHIASFRCTAPDRQQLGVKRTCLGHGWIDAINP